jgi:hypothetical protein
MKNIEFPKVEGVSIAIVRQESETEPTEVNWTAMVINTTDKPLVNVLVATKGYGELDGEKQRTSVLRHLITRVDPGEAAPIERVDPQVFPLVNEFWLSYYKEEEPTVIYDKKFLFLPDSIIEDNVSRIPGFDLRGVLHD